MSRTEVVKDSEEIQRCKREIIDEIEGQLENITLKYGRATTTHALRKAYVAYSGRRFVNPYPIDDDLYHRLVDMTEGNRKSVAGMDKGDVVESISNWYDSLPEEQRHELASLYREEGDAVLYAYVDLKTSDLFFEERDEYVETAVAAIIELINRNQ